MFKQPCYLCQKEESSFFCFKRMNYFCNDCLNKTLKLNKCEISHDMENCSKQFEKYQWLNEIKSKGINGCIYNVYNKSISANTVLKVQGYYELTEENDKTSDTEIHISCLVSELPNFAKLINYWICDIEPVDELWKSSMCRGSNIEDSKMIRRVVDNQRKWVIEPGRSNKIFYLEMKKYQGTLKDLKENYTKFTEHDKFSFLFELVYSLDNAYKQIGLHHNDIHAGNMFYEFNDKPREYTLNLIKNNKRSQIIVICKSLFFPIWGDFGESSINEEDEDALFNSFEIIMDYLKIKYSKDPFFQNGNAIVKNQDFLIWLGEKVMNSDNNKKQKIK